MTSSFCFRTPYLLPSPTRGRKKKASDSPSVERRFLAGAVAFERAFLADRIGTLEDPVLPGGEASKDFRFHGFGAAETQVGFEAGEAVGREARALFKEHAHLVPVDVIKRERDEAEFLCGLGIEHVSALRPSTIEIG